MKNWHTFRETPDGDDECSTCNVVVSTEAHLTFTLSCPASDCPAASNPDRGCVFVPGRADVSACVYCGRPGTRASEPHVSDLELDVVTADLIGDEPAT